LKKRDVKQTCFGTDALASVELVEKALELTLILAK